MEKDDFTEDDFLGRLIRQNPLDSPSDDFVNRVMAGIQTVPEIASVRKPIFWYLKVMIPYILLFMLFFVVFATSDLPFLNWLPGKSYYLNHLVPYFGTLFAGLKNSFSSKYVSLGLLVMASTAFLFIIDRVFTRKTAA